MAPSALKQPIVRVPETPISSHQEPSNGLGALIAGPVPLVLADVLSLTVAVYLARAFHSLAASPAEGAATASGMGVVFIGLSLLGLALAQAYHPLSYGSPGQEWPRIVGAVSVAFTAVWVSSLAFGPDGQAPDLAAWTWGTSVVALIGGRLLTKHALQTARSHGVGAQRVVVVGTPRSAVSAVDRLLQKGAPYEIAGLVTVGALPAPAERPAGFPVLGRLDALPAILQSVRPSELLITVPLGLYPRVQRALSITLPPGTSVRLALDPLLEGLGTWDVEKLDGASSIHLKAGGFSWNYENLKRAFDTVAASAALVLASPFMLLIAAAIKLDSPGPVLYRQTRVGRGGRLFSMYKFRSMKVNAESMLQELAQKNEAAGPMFKMKDDPRITRVGRVIRKLSLDELPQLFNVLDGSMSIVGPRPPLPDEVKKYEPWHFRRLEAIPGITGLWQVSRGNDISFDEMVELDLEYMRRWSFLLDLEIMLRTVPIVLTGRGSY
jgi:exopolysaccharide biosynthesis polyprenyl glycosylphosphotransferase